MSPLSQKIVPSPVGALRLVATDAALAGVFFPNHKDAPLFTPTSSNGPPSHPILDLAAREFAAYFRGELQVFTTPHAAQDGTPWQRAVWAALSTIPFGERRSYAELAAQIGNPNAARAVGAANALNPLSIIVPCHRVVGADGSLTGFAGGMPAKKWLLAHEQRVTERVSFTLRA